LHIEAELPPTELEELPVLPAEELLEPLPAEHEEPPMSPMEDELTSVRLLELPPCSLCEEEESPFPPASNDDDELPDPELGLSSPPSLEQERKNTVAYARVAVSNVCLNCIMGISV
jgi:hypothetical protein